jgi:hypothetical protein
MSETQAKHTEGKLTVIPKDQAHHEQYIDGRGGLTRFIVWRSDDGEADATRLALCWNMHDELLDALRKMRNEYTYSEDQDGPILALARAVLAKAEKGGE